MTTLDEKTAAYNAAMIAGLPQGPAFPRENTANRDALLRAIAREFAIEDNVIDTMIAESSPLTANLTITEWEADYGLPDCDHQHATTLQERRAAVHEKRTRVGSLNPNAIIAMAAKLGYEAEVIERRPFVGGLSRGGDRVSGPHKCRYWWSVKVFKARLTWFRGGVSRGGEKQLSIARAEDLVCVLERINHSQTKLTFAYEGA
ncbi:putative phage tail protein [Thalassospira xiamenensis]|uniref:Uncharacterized protein YmfQ in lambdoid prophage, DUF2313 family n=1 Tax=Thalassospira xiamenensis TaxID=220697 RepID=A0A285TVP6_9PROT|nr:putative phage tail protein [Thalassospira xiamenensis]SOC28222.1 Uncharacterized protein YmfQ in lambdoid prophage, DUF2313 family [Thalassospira xiamenensis]